MPRRPYELEGPERGLREVDRELRRRHDSEQRPPSDEDRPPVSVFPMTPGAREALRLSRTSWPPRRE